MLALVAAVSLVLTETPPPEALAASAGVGFLNRSFGWSGPAASSFAGSTQPFAGTVAVDGAWFPGAPFTQGAGSWFGVSGRGEFALGLSALSQRGAVFPQQALRVRGGLEARFPVGDAVSIAVHAGYAQQAFSTSTVATNGSTLRAPLPDLRIEGPRLASGVRVRFAERFRFDGLVGFQLATALGELRSATWFPEARGVSLDVDVGVSMRLAEAFQLKLGVTWLRTFLTLDAQSRASEQSVTGALQAQWVW